MKRICAALVLLLPAAAHAQSDALVVKLGNDTIAVENFTLTPTRLEGELITRGMGPRMTYAGDVVMGRIRLLRTAAYNETDTTALQTALLTFSGDSVIARIAAPGRDTVTQRLPSAHAALPLINLAFSFVELATIQAVALKQDSAIVPFFLVSGGRSFTAILRRVAPDSFTVTLSGADLVLKTDAHGRILRGAVPAQNVTIARSAGRPARLEVEKPDYSAPADARYTAEAVKITTPQGHVLAGTLTLPKRRPERVPVVVTISGSGLQDRDEALPIVRGYRPFRQIAEHLANAGIAVLRYDDRGFGESTGNPATATSADFAEDTRAVLAYLRARSDVAADKLFLLGHSEGGIIAPMIAATDRALRGIILMAGTARTGRRVVDYQSRYMLEQRAELTPPQRDSILRSKAATIDSTAARQPWFRYFLAYDPLPTIRKVEVPVLIVQGATDRQVTADQANELGAALREAGNKAVDVHVLPDVNHLFLRDPVGSPTGYGALKDTRVVAEATELIRGWVLKHVN